MCFFFVNLLEFGLLYIFDKLYCLKFFLLFCILFCEFLFFDDIDEFFVLVEFVFMDFL